jgi:manganese/zinc/iron transport system substrate-binding protein
MAKKFVNVCASFCLILFMGSCYKQEPQEVSLKPQVVSTTAMIAELVESIAQDKIVSQVLIKGDIDPHSYELVKGDQLKLKKADLIFYQGLGLEHGASLSAYLRSQSKAVCLGDFLKRSCPESLIEQDGYLDPHVWLDLDLWKQLIPFVSQKLIELVPDEQLFFEANAQRLTETMTSLDRAMLEMIQALPEKRRYLVTSHSAFRYFTRRYIAYESDWVDRCIAPEGLAPEAQISLYDIEKVVCYIRDHQVSVVFSESNVSKEALKKVIHVCHKSGLDVKLDPQPLFGDALFDGKRYLDMMWHNATLLHKAWHEQATPSQD